METRLAIREELEKTPLSKINVTQLKEWAHELRLIPWKGKVVRKNLEELLIKELERLNIYDRLVEFFDQENAIKIMNSPYFDEEKLCSLIPYLCNKSDIYDEDKMQVLLLLPDFFFRYGKNVDQVPDFRRISEEGRKRFNLEEWRPWSLLREEVEIFTTQENRDETYGSVVYNALEQEEIFREITIYGVPQEKRDLYEKDPYSFQPPGTVVYQYDPFDVVPLFFDTYPILSYLLLLVNHLPVYAAEYDHMAAMDIVKRTVIEENRYEIALVANREIVDFLLKKEDLPYVLRINRKYHTGILSWLYDHMKSREDLMIIAIANDNPTLYFRLREDLKNDYKGELLDRFHIPYQIYIKLVKEEPQEWIRYLITFQSIPWITQVKILDAFGDSLHRFVDSVDLLQWAINEGNIAFIYFFIEHGEGEEPTKETKTLSLPPILHIYNSPLLSDSVKDDIMKRYSRVDLFGMALERIKNDEMINFARTLIKERKVNYTREQFIEALKMIEKTNRRAHGLAFDIIKIME